MARRLTSLNSIDNAASKKADLVGFPPQTSNWIIQHHDAWSRVTLSSFYKKLAEGALTPKQYTRWILDRTSIAVALAKGARRTSASLHAHRRLPLLEVAERDADWFLQRLANHGLSLHESYSRSHPADRLISLIESATSQPSSLVVSITVLWGYMMVSWQAWALSLRRERTLPTGFDMVANHLSRAESIERLVETQDILDGLLKEPKLADEVEKASKSFEEMLKRANGVLDQTLHIGEQGQAPLCTCGRKGHTPDQCTFKSHI